MSYIIHMNHKHFVVINDNDTTLTSDHTKATKYDKIGDAMKAAGKLNTDFNRGVAKIISV